MSEPKRNKLKNINPQTSSKNEIEEPVLENEAEPKKAKLKKSNPEPKAKSKPTETVSKEKISFAERFEKFKLFYFNERTQKIIGLLSILLAVFFAAAFSSYLFTWEEDQDKVLGPSSVFFSNETKVQNLFGKFGAMVSHLFIYKWFGLASFLMVPLFVSIGLNKLITRRFLFLQKLNSKIIFFTVWSSVLLGFLFSEKWFYLGGGFGYIISEKLKSLIGSFGTIAVIVFALLAFLVIVINFSFQRKKEEPEVLNNDINENPEEETQEEPLKNKLYTSPTFEEDELSAEEERELLDIKVKTVDEEKKTFGDVDFEITTTAEVPTDKEEEAKPENEIELSNESNTVVTPKNKGEVDLEIEESVKEEILLNDDENKAQKLVDQFGEYDPTLDLGSYQFPTIDLLESYGKTDSNIHINQEELTTNKNRILDTLKNYGIEIEKIKATVGPTVTLYEIVPAAGVRISKIKNLEDDIALSLSALGIRIIAPIPGKGTIGIEVPNQTAEMVPMRNILASEKFQNSGFDLPIALGKTISNETFITDLAKMPHLLMAGATGQGKSVGLNAVLVSLLYKKHPSQIKFVLVDPKKVELTLFNKIERHFLAKLPNTEEAIITDTTKVVHTLNSLCIEMDNRYELLKDAQCRNLKEYNAKFVARKLNPNDGHKYLPYIVLVVDEFADLIMTAGKEVETPIARLAQLARAIGIHLIIATQRPSVNIITGTIKANFPARIAFRVTSKIDSRTILDAGGAEQLIGRGDMLLSTGNDLIRIQCAFVDTPEVEKICDFIGAQRAYPSAFMLPEYIDENAEGPADIDLAERDKMFDEAAKIIVQHQQGSASLLQRKLKLGYNRAGRIVDQLEAAGIIGPFEGSKARDVLIKDLVSLDEILKRLKDAHS